MMSSGLGCTTYCGTGDITFGYRSSFISNKKGTTLQVATMSNPMILAGLKTGEIDIGIGRMSDLN